MRLFSSAVGAFHGKSNTETPFRNLHQLTAPDIDLHQFNFSSLAGQVIFKLQYMAALSHHLCCRLSAAVIRPVAASGRPSGERRFKVRQNRS